MRLFVCECYGPYTGGAVVAVAESIQGLNRLLKQGFTEPPLIDDNNHIIRYNLWQRFQMLIHNDEDRSAECGDPEAYLEDLKFLCEELVGPTPWLFTEVSTCFNNRANQYSSGEVRHDWAFREFLKDIPSGLYIVDIINDVNIPEGIISDTYHCA